MTIFGKILLGLILVTGAILIIKGSPKEEPGEMVSTEPTEETVAVEESADVQGSFRGSMTDLLARGGDYKCVFTHSTDVADSSGTVYISGKKMRGDFKSNTKPTTTSVESHMIMDGEFYYMWSSAMPSGLKMKISEETTASADSNASTGMDVNQELDYSCEVFAVTETQFSLPAGVTFTELPQA